MEPDTGRNEIAVSRGYVTESGEACIVGSLCEKLLTQIYFWLYNERWTARGLAGSVGEYKAKEVMGEVERGVEGDGVSGERRLPIGLDRWID